MSCPVRDPRWAGGFECSGPCRRKRLIAGEFSAKQLQKRQKDPGFALTCKSCVEAKAQAERDAAAGRSMAAAASGDDAGGTTVCSSCGKGPAEGAAFSKTQLRNAAHGKPAKCLACAAKAEADNNAAGDAKFEAKLAEARKAREAAERSGDAAAVLKASALEAAIEGERVTGVKASGGGRGRGRCRGRGRGANTNSMLGRGRGRGKK